MCAVPTQRALVVIPTYNEAENIVPLAQAVLEQDASLDVLVVDDASPDGTGERVQREGKREPRLLLLARPGKLGLGSAYLAGFRYGLDHGYDQILTMDGDGSHPPRFLPAVLEAARGADLVIGSRYVPGGGIQNWPPHRRALSAFANFYTRVLLGLSVRDCTAGFRLYRRRVLEEVNPFSVRSSGYSFLEEMLFRTVRAGFRVAEVPILFEDRRAGTSKISQREIYRAAVHVLMTALRWRLRGGA